MNAMTRVWYTLAVPVGAIILGIVPPDTSREVLGLLMAGVPTEEALASASRTKLAEEDNTMQAIGQDVRHES